MPPVPHPPQDPGLLSTLVADGRPLLVLVALGLILSGLFAFFLAVTGSFLPHDIAFLGMQPADLCSLHQCRLVHFLFHDRVSFGGTLFAIGTLYLWLLAFPLQAGEEWAWWTLLLSSILGFLSFLAYLIYGYLDSWHAVASAGLLPLFVAGIWKTHALLPPHREGWRSLLHPASPFSLRSRPEIGRVLLLSVGAGMMLAGTVIILLGSTVVFVPQDLAYFGYTPAQLNAINPHLIPFIAHDRAGFGGGLASCGLVVLLIAWKSHPAKARWQALLVQASPVSAAPSASTTPWATPASPTWPLPGSEPCSTPSPSSASPPGICKRRQLRPAVLLDLPHTG